MDFWEHVSSTLITGQTIKQSDLGVSSAHGQFPVAVNKLVFSVRIFLSVLRRSRKTFWNVEKSIHSSFNDYQIGINIFMDAAHFNTDTF